jgi:hypothetical protein
MEADLTLVRNIANKMTKTELDAVDTEHDEFIDLTVNEQSVLSAMGASIDDLIFVQGHTFSYSPESVHYNPNDTPNGFVRAEGEYSIGSPSVPPAVQLSAAYDESDSEMSESFPPDSCNVVYDISDTISEIDTSGDAALAQALQDIYDVPEVPSFSNGGFTAEESDGITVNKSNNPFH